MPLRAHLSPIRSLLTSSRLSSRTMSSYSSPFAPKQGEKLSLTSSIKLQDGTTQPRLAIGAWAMNGQEAYNALVHAFKTVGYRHVDTAKYYRNEKETGQAIRDSGIPREEIYATTKLFTNAMGGGSRTEQAYQDSLSQSGLEYWDLVLLHAPDGESGKIRSLGVSNFGPHHIDELMSSKPKVKPVVNQIECHPFFAQTEVRKKCEENGIVVQAYCPLARGRYYGDDTLKQVAKRNNKSEAQVMLRWIIQSGMIPLPKSSNEQRQMENAESLQFELSADDMKALDALDRGQRGAVESQTLSQQAP